MAEAPYLKLSEAQALFAQRGYRLGADKRQRFASFGLHVKRIGRNYFVTAQGVQDFLYVLALENDFQLTRDHDGLAFELALRGYHTIPWQRVHRAAQKRVSVTLNTINRYLHLAHAEPGKGFSERRADKFAAQLANRLLSKASVRNNARLSILKEMLEFIFQLALKQAYCNLRITESHIKKIFYAIQFPCEGSTDALSSQLATMVNSTERFFVLDTTDSTGWNLFYTAIQSNASEVDVEQTCAMVRNLAPLHDSIASIIGISWPLSVAQYPAYPNEKANHPRETLALHAFFYSMACYLKVSSTAMTTIGNYRAGKSDEVPVALSGLHELVTNCRKLIEVYYDNPA